MLLFLALACRSDKDPIETGRFDSDPVQATDLDGDGYADDDCDDSDAAVNPGAVETPYNGVDDDCDDTTPDDDLDGDGVGAADDCDDTDAAVNPDAPETPYNGVDDDCDPSTAEDDLDGDGYNADEDCDDDDATRNPDAVETWYDGVDQDCDGADDFDQDGDGDAPVDQGGTDCDDLDPDRYGGLDCRPETDVEYAGSDTLNTDISGAFSDLVYDADGVLHLCTLISGTDYVYVYEDTTHTETLSGYSNWNMNAIALDTSSADQVIVGYTTGASLGYEAAGTLAALATGAASTGGAYANGYMAASPNSLAVDATGCIWATNFMAAGGLSCVLSDGTQTDYTFGSSYLDAVGLDSSDTVHVVEDDTVYSYEPSTGTATAVFTADAAILDFVFDYNDDLYVETADDEVLLVQDGSGTVLATVTGDGRLAIHPAGVLVRMLANPTSASSFESWTLE